MRHFLLLAAVVCFCVTRAGAQDTKEMKNKINPATDTLPYQKYPDLPAFNILLLDSTTIFNTFNIPKGKPSLIMFFDPDCKHCKAETKMLLRGMDSLKDINFYMITSVHNMDAIRKYRDEFHLGDYKNIEVIGRDYEFFYVTFYGIKYVPDIALYDARKRFVKFFEGHTTVKELYDYTH